MKALLEEFLPSRYTRAGQHQTLFSQRYGISSNSIMNAPTFDAHSPLCPVCHRPHPVKSHRLLTGLLVCQHCRERLVVSWSGHYVRDPFTLNQLASARTLRRESHPFFRILRDLRLTRVNVLLTVLAGILVFGLLNSWTEQRSPDLDAPQPNPASVEGP